MRLILTYLLLLYIIVPAIGQQNSSIEKDIKQSGIHFLEMTPITFAIRANYTYSFKLLNNEKGMQGSLISKDGVKPEKGDELIFVNEHNDRKSFEFYDHFEETKKAGRPIYTNYFFIDYDDIQWLKTYRTINFYIKKTQLLQMRKFSLSSVRATKLINMLETFTDTLDRTLVNRPVVVESDPHAPGTKWFEPSKSRATGVQSIKYINEVPKELGDEKEKLKRLIDEENTKAELITNQLREEVAQARINALLQKEKFAKEVKRARETSLTEIENINTQTAQYISEQKELTDNQTEELAWEVYNAKIKSAEAISKIKNRSDEKLLDHENELSSELTRLDKDYTDAQDHYSTSVQTAKQKSVDEINRIRKMSSIKLDSLQHEFQRNAKSISGKNSEVAKKENEALFQYKEMILDSIARMQETLSRIKERNAQDLAKSNSDYKGKKILLQKEGALEIAALKNKTEEKRSEIKVNAVEEIERYNQALREAKEVRQEEMALLKQHLDSVKLVHETLIVDERHKLEMELQEVASAVVQARTRSAEAVQQASQKSTFRISEIQNFVEERRVELLRELDEDRKKIQAKRDENLKIYASYQKTQGLKMDSIENYYVSTYRVLKDNFDRSLFKTKTRNDSMLGVMESDFQRLKKLYADSIQLIHIRAQQKIKEVDRKSGDEAMADATTSKKESIKFSKEIIRLQANHEEALLKEKQLLAKEMMVLRRGHQEHIADIQLNIKNEVNAEFIRLKDVRSSFREEMGTMNTQYLSFKNQQQKRLNEESERFKEIMASTRLNQLSELLRIDSIHNKKKMQVIKKYEAENDLIKTKLDFGLKQLKDSLQMQFQKYDVFLTKLNDDFTSERDSLRKQEIEIKKKHNTRIYESEQSMLQKISENERISANEVYQSKQSARDEIAKIKENTLKELNEIQDKKKKYELELRQLEQAIKIRRAELNTKNKE